MITSGSGVRKVRRTRVEPAKRFGVPVVHYTELAYGLIWFRLIYDKSALDSLLAI